MLTPPLAIEDGADEHAPMTTPAELLVCVKCRIPGVEPAPDEPRPGQRLYETLRAAPALDGVSVTPVECLSNCKRGCTVALRGGAERWSYVYGGFDTLADMEGGVAVIRDGAQQYHATTDGVVPWRQRPEHFKRNCIARIPPLTQPAPESADD